MAACSDGGSANGDDDGACTPLDDATLAALTHSAWASPSVEIQPGMQRALQLGTVELGGAFSPVAACAAWSIAPAAAGVSIDAETGVIRVTEEAVSNQRFVVTADVDGAKLITADVFVFREAEMPWRGLWREDSQLECGTSDEVTPQQRIEEIIFWADGTLWVTWTPFEVYVDYWGTHAFDPSAQTATFAATGGNYVPADLDGTGTFTLTGDTMTLSDLWLGSARHTAPAARCGHTLVR
jgi:hypothetical protein